MSKYPESVPVLTADDFQCGSSCEFKSAHCLIEWTNIVFSMDAVGKFRRPMDAYFDDVPDRVLTTMRKVVDQIEKREGMDLNFPQVYDAGSCVSQVIEFNDECADGLHAEVWNTTMQRLGYTEVSYVKETPWDFAYVSNKKPR